MIFYYFVNIDLKLSQNIFYLSESSPMRQQDQLELHLELGIESFKNLVIFYEKLLKIINELR